MTHIAKMLAELPPKPTNSRGQPYTTLGRALAELELLKAAAEKALSLMQQVEGGHYPRPELRGAIDDMQAVLEELGK